MQLHETFIDRPEWGAQEAAADEEFHYLVLRMGSTNRLQVVRKGLGIAEYGWQYKTVAHAMYSLAMWEPDIQDEPLLWIKRTGGDVRQAPQRAGNIEYNLPRCEHGSYLHEQNCDIDRFCREMRHRQGSQ